MLNPIFVHRHTLLFHGAPPHPVPARWPWGRPLTEPSARPIITASGIGQFPPCISFDKGGGIMKRNRIQNIQVLWVPQPGGIPVQEKLDEFRAGVIERRLRGSNLSPAQQTALLDRLLEEMGPSK